VQPHTLLQVAATLRDNPDLRGVSRITLFQSFRCFRLVLWDESCRRLVSFRHVRMQSLARRHFWASRELPVNWLACELRKNWLNPPDLVRVEPEIVSGYRDRIVPKDTASAASARWPIDTHLDAAVALRTTGPRISLPPSVIQLKYARI
jgi:hypothetical protein